MAVRPISIALALALLLGSHPAAYAEGPRAPSPQWLARDAQRRGERRPTFPFSRFFTSRLNPLALFGLVRFIGARGFLGRIKTGGMLGNDVRSVRRILLAKHEGMSGEQATQAAERIKQLSDEGHFFDEGPQYPISRFFTSRLVWGTLGFVDGLLNGAANGFSSLGVLATGAAHGASEVGSVWLGRVLAARGLAGRIITDKSLMQSEDRLLSTLANGLAHTEVSPTLAPDSVRAPDSARGGDNPPAPVRDSKPARSDRGDRGFTLFPGAPGLVPATP